MAKVQNTDVLAVGRGSATYKATFQEVASSLPAAPTATTTTKGMVQLADAAAITTGTAGHVVDAAQLKAAISATPTGGLTGITGTAPITASGTGATRAISISDATNAASGAMSATDKTKLDGIAAGAEVNVQVDWSVTDNTSDAFIKNKPTIPAAYTLPVASTTVLGGIKKGAGYTIASDGTLNITFPAALTFKGTADPTTAAPAAPAVGDVYVASKTGTAAASWTGLTPRTVLLHELLVWDGSEWAGAGVGATTGVTSVTTTANTGITVGGTPTAPVVSGSDATESAKGVVQLASVAEAKAGTNTAKAVTAAGVKAAIAALAGSAAAAPPTGAVKGNLWIDTSGAVPVVKVYDGTTWHGLADLGSPAFTGTPSGPTAAAGTSTTQLATTAFVQAAQPWSRAGTTLSPKTPGDLVAPAALPDATATVKGAVRLADAAAVTAGTAGRVVDAAQLKAHTPANATETVKGIVQLADAAAITAGTAGRVVDAAQLKAHTPANATETVKGIVELATAAETTTGTDATRAVHPAGLKVELDKKVNKAGDTMTGNLTVPSLNGGQLAGTRNVLINGDLRINQRSVTIAAAAVGGYGPDRWKKVDASHMTQIVEDVNYVHGAVYTLSGTGVTTQQLTAPASGHWTLPSIPITATNIQLELGTVATPFEHRSYGLELALCQRYYEDINAEFKNDGVLGGPNISVGHMWYTKTIMPAFKPVTFTPYTLKVIRAQWHSGNGQMEPFTVIERKLQSSTFPPSCNP
jgi:hypothetical protein